MLFLTFMILMIKLVNIHSQHYDDLSKKVYVTSKYFHKALFCAKMTELPMAKSPTFFGWGGLGPAIALVSLWVRAAKQRFS